MSCAYPSPIFLYHCDDEGIPDGFDDCYRRADGNTNAYCERDSCTKYDVGTDCEDNLPAKPVRWQCHSNDPYPNGLPTGCSGPLVNGMWCCP